MAEARTVARPYADAALQFAVAAGTTKEWSTQLKMLATIAADEQTQRVIKNPRVTREQLVTLFTDVADKTLIEGGSNFIRLLAEYDRLIILPEIHEEYQRLLAEKQRYITAQVRSAQPLDEQQTQQLTAALAKRFDCTVSLEIAVDETLLGGALAQIGDLVIDGSLRGRLTRLAATLRS